MPGALRKTMVVLTDGMDNTAYLNPDDNRYYTVTGIVALNPAPPPATVATNAFAPPADVKVFAVGLGDWSRHPPQPAGDALERRGWQGLGGRSDLAEGRVQAHEVLHPNLHGHGRLCHHQGSGLRYLSWPNARQRLRLAALRRRCIVVMYDLMGIRLPFFLETPVLQVDLPVWIATLMY